MKTLNDIRQQIAPALQRVEDFRLKKLEIIAGEKRWYGIPIILLIASVSVGVGGFAFTGIGLGVIAIVGFVLVCVFRVTPHRTAYMSNFKEEVFASFIKALYPNTYYAPANYLPSTLFAKSELFGSYDAYKGEDYFEGQTDNGCTFKFSELYVTETRRTTDSDGDTTTSTTTVFDGMFFVLDVPNRVDGRIQILPDSAESTFGRIGKFMQKKVGSFFQGATMIYMEDHPEFEKEFVVYSKNEAEAYRILNPHLLNAIYDLRYRWNTKMSISFIGHQIYVALPTSKNFFHPDINRSTLDDQLIREIYEELALCFAVVEDLSMEHEPSKSWEDLNAAKEGNSKNNPFLL